MKWPICYVRALYDVSTKKLTLRMEKMKSFQHYLSLFWIIIFLNVCLGEANSFTPQLSKRNKWNFNTGWKFHLGNPTGTAYKPDYDDSKWDDVSIPHTLKLTSLYLDDVKDNEHQNTFHRYVGWYRKVFTLNANKQSDLKVFLEFEGAHQVTDVWINGKHIGQHAISGYTPFHFDITEHVNFQGMDNVVVVKVDNTKNENVPPDGGPRDYILFGGLYRDVYLVVTNKLHIIFSWEDFKGGTFVTTPSVSADSATIKVKTTVRNEYSEEKDCNLVTRIVDADGKTIKSVKSSHKIDPGADYSFTQSLMLSNPRLWSLDEPYLYRVQTAIFDGQTPLDNVENPLGIRRCEVDAKKGFSVNGQTVHLIGVNRHQMYPYIGNAVPDSLHRQDAYKIKQAGFNIVRLSHYPQDEAFLDACDEFGIFVLPDAPTWIEELGERWKQNLVLAQRRMIRAQRNHPCVLMWPGGINHLGCKKYLHDAAKEEDTTRMTHSCAAEWAGNPLDLKGCCDVFSTMKYDEPFKMWDRLQVNIESPPEDLHLISDSKGIPGHFGSVLWCAFDYNNLMNEAGKRNVSSAYGIWDIFRVPKPILNGYHRKMNYPYYWYKSELTKEPMVFISNTKVGGEIVVYSNCDEVELFVDGVSQGKRGPDKKAMWANLAHPPFSFGVIWKSGELKATGFIKGQKVARHTRKAAGKPARLRIEVDMAGRNYVADGADIVMVYVWVEDAEGTVVYSAETEVELSVSGPAKIVGDGAEIGANPVYAKREDGGGVGYAPFMVQSTTTPGTITLTATAPGLKSASARSTSIKFVPY